MAKEPKKLQKLEKDNDELENYFRNTIIPQLFIDGELILRKFTPPAMKQFNLSTSDLGRSILEIKDNFRFPHIQENIEQVIQTKEILEKEIQTTDMRWYQMNVIPYVLKADNSTDGVIMTFVEITARIRNLQDLARLIADHEVLLDTLSHDIKNPLSQIILSVQVLKELENFHREPEGTLIRGIETSVNTMRELINDLTESRLHTNAPDMPAAGANLSQIIEDVRLGLRAEINAADALFETDVQVEQIHFVRRKLRSVIYNLLSNSLKYKSSDRQTKVLIKSERLKNGDVRISVKDNGIGIEKDKQADVFTKYVRLNKNIEGTGVGLHLVKQIVESQNGTVTLQSELDKGTEIAIVLKDQQ